MSRSSGRQLAMATDPEYQLDFASTATESHVENALDQLREAPNGRVYGGLGQLLPGGSVGDPKAYHEVTTTEVNFLFRSGAKLEGHLFAPLEGDGGPGAGGGHHHRIDPGHPAHVLVGGPHPGRAGIPGLHLGRAGPGRVRDHAPRPRPDRPVRRPRQRRRATPTRACPSSSRSTSTRAPSTRSASSPRRPTTRTCPAAGPPTTSPPRRRTSTRAANRSTG